MSGAVLTRSVIDQFPQKRALRLWVSRNCPAFPLSALRTASLHRLRDDYCETPALIQENQQPAVRLSQNVVSVDPDSLTMTPSPMSRSPNVIRAAHVITSAAIVIRPIANFHGNGAWVSCIPRTIACAIRAVTSVIWSAISWISSSVIIIGATAYTHYD